MARHKAAFLVNVWFETSDNEEPKQTEWRGSVQHLMTQQQREFTQIADLVTFLTTYPRQADYHDKE
jgi:hypothetical protein